MDYRIEQLRYLLREDASSRIFFQLGELLRREGDAAEAVKVLRTGLERHPRYVAAWVSLGRSYRDLDSLAEAENAFETALGIDRENSAAARLLGETAAERGNWLQAVKALKLTRALTGGDDELNAQIARVEERLDEDGRLERAVAKPPRVEAQARRLEVVSFSGDDPFSASSDDADLGNVASDVFGFSEDSAELEEGVVSREDATPFGDGEVTAVADEEPPLADEEVADGPEASGPPDVEVIGAADVRDLGEHPADALEEIDDRTTESAHPIDESSVGAWSPSVATGGVSGGDAWTEPNGEFRLSDDRGAIGGGWSEPTAAIGSVEVSAAEIVVFGAPGADEAPASEPSPTEVFEASEAKTFDDAAEVPDTVVADGGPPVVRQAFDSIEVTHPMVIERRRAETEETLPPEPVEVIVEDVVEELGEAAGDEILPGADRGKESAELTRPIAVDPQLVEVHPAPEAGVEDVDAEFGEAAGDGRPGKRAELGGRRHDLEHGVPLPTMTLAKLAFQQNDRPLAMATLESLLDRDPSNVEALAMLDELTAQDETVARAKVRAAHATAKIVALQGWLDEVRLAAERRVQ